MSNGRILFISLVLLFQLGFLAGLNYQIAKMRDLQKAIGQGVAALLIDSSRRQMQEINPALQNLTPEERELLRDYMDREKKRTVY